MFYGILLAGSALVELLTEQRMKWWVWLINAAGILSCLSNIFRCRLLQEKADSE